MPDGILPVWRAKVADGSLRDDTAQRLAAEKLQLLHTRLKGYDPVAPKRVSLALFGWGRERLETKTLPGLYLYGGVGRGKSMIMDLFFASEAYPRKRRVHFHAFMQEVHDGIHAARQKGIEDPVLPVADAIADEAVLLCFDELQITDITDAMLVGRLFERLFERGVVVVSTSNRHPDELYKDGLNRALFLPFIEMIKDRLEVHHLESPTDHRQARLQSRRVYFTPLGTGATAGLDRAWAALAGGKGQPLILPIKGRTPTIPEYLNGVGRASFAHLCEAPLGPADYLEIAKALRVLILDNIPMLSAANQNEAKRFVTLIDALYEARVRLIASAAAGPEVLYLEGKGAFEFQRTASRLAEMRSAGWGDEVPVS